MATCPQRHTILMADDDAEDCLLVRDALREAGLPYEIHFVRHGLELLDYLRHEGEYEDERSAPRPDLILLDIKMPCMDGRETLRELKTDRRYRHIPVIALTTSIARDDVETCYDMGVNSYIAKPTSFRELVRVVEVIGKYWFEVVELPPKLNNGKTN